MIKAIVAVDNKWGIGRNNHLLADIPEDMEFFKFITTGSTVIMGMNTFRSMYCKPLPNRKNIVICRTDDVNPHNEKDLTFMNITEAKYFLQKNYNNNIFIIGGSATYNIFLEFCDLVFVTKIQDDLKADTFFNNLDEDFRWKCISKMSPKETKSGLTIQFCKYERTTNDCFGRM